MNTKMVGISLMLIAGLLAACEKNNSTENNAGGVASTPQVFPAPGVQFYSDGDYSDVEIEKSYYFGNRVAYLYYIGANPAGRNPSNECLELKRAGRNALPMAYSKMGGYNKSWREERGRRYGRVSSRCGDSLGQVQAWKNLEGQQVTKLHGGSYLVCVLDQKRHSDHAMGFYFEANPQLQSQMGVHMGFKNYQAQFSRNR